MDQAERDRIVADAILLGECPFGELKPGQAMAHCHLGFPGCGCADEMMLNPYLAHLMQSDIEKGERVMTETEKKVERARAAMAASWRPTSDDCQAMLDEHDRLKAELERLTTLRPASEHDGETRVLWWWQIPNCEKWFTSSASDDVLSGWWTSLPTPREKEDDLLPAMTAEQLASAFDALCRPLTAEEQEENKL
jgi:hypothetical protein